MKRLYSIPLIFLALFLLLGLDHVKAQTVVPIVPVGKGSYGNGTPFDLARNTWGDDGNWKVYNQMMAMHGLWPERWRIAVADTNTRALPTNDEWVGMIFQKDNDWGGTTWNSPTAISLKPTSSNVWFPNAWKANGSSLESGTPIQIEPAGAQNTLTATKCTVINWNDWTTEALLTDNGTNRMNVVFGHGFPYVWYAPNFNPTIQFSTATTCTSDGTTPITFPYTGDQFVGLYNGKSFAIFMPPNTTVTRTGAVFKLTFSGAAKYFVVGLLNSAADFAVLKQYAYVKPVDTQVKWTYNQSAGTMNVNWTVKGINLKGEANTNVLQGFIPHHYQRSLSTPAFNGMTYLTAKGTMKCAVGKSFDFSYRFSGILPNVPTPKKNPTDKFPFDSVYLAKTITDASTRTAMGTDIYWGLKPLLRQSRYASMAESTNHPKAGVLKTTVRNAFKDWLTYTPGETAHAFYKYNENSKLGALVGFDPGAYSATFTDHDMCYGYMMNAAAQYAMTDPSFLKDYGGMLRMMAKHINNWERGDKSYPYLRLMDPWNGHSWAGGNSGADVESVSECMQFAAGMFLIGEMTNDQPMRDAGAFVYSSMSRAYDQYIRDVDNINFTPAFSAVLPVAAKLNNNGPALGNYVGGQALYWINWIPYSPPMNFFFSDTTAARSKYDRFMTTWKSNQANWGSDFWNNLTMYLHGFDNDQALQMWNDNFAEYQDDDLHGITYYYLHSTNNLGSIDWTRWTSSPTSQVYYNNKTKQYTYVAYNSTATEQTVTAYNNGTAIGTFKVPPYTTVATHLDAVLSSIKITANSDVVKPSSTLQLTAVGLDQYGGSINITGPVTWSVLYGGGTVNTAGLYTAPGVTADSVVVKAVNGTLKATYTLRVGNARTPYKLVVSPAYQKIPQSGVIYYDTYVYDQYGGLLPSTGIVWTTSGGGTITQEGTYIAGTVTGTYTNTVTLGNLSFTAIVVVYPPLNLTDNIALLRPSFTDNAINTTNKVASKANDGDEATRWETVHEEAIHWWYVKLDTVYDLSQVEIVWDGSAAAVYAIQTSTDGIKWTTVDSMSTGTYGHTGEFDLFSKNVTGSYIRVYCYTRATVYGYSIKEFRAYGTKAVKPKPLTKIVVNPGVIELKIGQKVLYTATGYNIDGVIVAIPGTWSVIGGGTINTNGLFTAQSNGTYIVKYTSGTIVGQATVKIASESSSKQLTSFGFSAPAVSGTISGSNILVSMPMGTDLSNLKAVFSSSASSTVKVGSVIQTSGVTANNFTTTVVYIVVAEDGSSANYTVVFTLTTGIDDIQDAASFTVYPNPANGGILTIESETSFDLITIKNMSGQEVMNYGAGNVKNLSIDVSGLAKGIYYLKVSCLDRTLDRKIVIQ